MKTHNGRSGSAWRHALLVVAGAACVSVPLAGQVPGREGLVTAEGRRLDFAADGVWRMRARAVAGRRAALRAAGRVEALNAERVAGFAAAQVSGDFRLPSILLGYAGSDTTVVPAAVFDSLFYQLAAPDGRPYTLRSYYAELSNNALNVTGSVTGWTPVDSTLSWVVEPCVGNGGLCTFALRRLTIMFRAALAAADGSVDFSQFDNDGPDNLPNTQDDDGVVDVVQFVQPAIGAECGGPGVWAHKGTINANDPVGGVFVTNDAAFGGGNVSVNSYFVTAGVGGPDCADPGRVMGIGLAAHEFGHGIGLPDLYDTFGATNGIGEWGLMGSAMYTSLSSPGHYGAWSKETLGWLTVRELSASGSYQIGPVITSDTVFLIRPAVPNPRGEYFLVENRQPVLADTANLMTGGKAGPKLGGLVVWHIDSTSVAQGSANNTVNAGTFHGVAVVQADGVADLDKSASAGNRGDAGDPFPGDSGRTKFSFATVPPGRLHSNGGFVGFQLAAITQLVPNGPLAFDLSLGLPNVVRATDTLAFVAVNTVPYRRFIDFVDPALPFQISIDSAQTSADGRSRFVFTGWSDGGAMTHDVLGLTPGDSVVAAVDGRHRLRATVAGDGSLQTGLMGDLSAGAFVASDSGVTITALPDSGRVLDSWFGDTNAVNPVLVVPMSRPFDVTAWFVNVLTFTGDPPPTPIAGAPYNHTLMVRGGQPAERLFRLVSGSMPPGLVLTQNGAIQGIPVAVGVYPVLVEVRSGSQSIGGDLQLDPVAPDLDLDDVLGLIVGAPSTLTADELRFLDLAGNGNGSVDIGDFLAWVESLGLSPRAARQVQPAPAGGRAR